MHDFKVIHQETEHTPVQVIWENPRYLTVPLKLNFALSYLNLAPTFPLPLVLWTVKTIHPQIQITLSLVIKLVKLTSNLTSNASYT